MTLLKRWWVIPVVIGAIVTGGLVAAKIEDEKNKIAAYGAIVATVSILLNAEKHIRDRLKEDRERDQKEDEKKEKLKATVQYRCFHVTTPNIGVELYNDGKTLVPIKGVWLVVVHEGELQPQAMVCTDFKEPFTRYTGGGGIPTPVTTHERTYKNRIDLQPKGHARFHEMIMGDIGDKVLGLKPENVYIVVESFANAELVKIPGEEIQAEIKRAKEMELR